jgi:hypothetical protein
VSAIECTFRKRTRRRRRSRSDSRCSGDADNRHTGHIDLDGLQSPKISVFRANIRKTKRRESLEVKEHKTYNYTTITAYSHEIYTICGKNGRFVWESHQNPPLAAQGGEISV